MRGRAALEQLAEEDRHHPGLPVRVLPRAVHVAVAEDQVAGAVEAVLELQVVLAAELADPVRGHRGAGRRLRRGDGVDLAVDGAAGGREDHPSAGAAGRGQHLDRPPHVDVRVETGILDRHPHVGLSGQVQDRLRPELVDERSQAVGVADVQLVELGARRHPLPPARCEVVDDGDAVAAIKQPVGDVRADEPGSAGDNGADRHGRGRYPEVRRRGSPPATPRPRARSPPCARRSSSDAPGTGPCGP